MNSNQNPFSSQSIYELSRFIGEKVCLQGWVYNFRSSGKVCFILLRDGTGDCQCVLSYDEKKKESFEVFKSLTQESLVEIKGLVKKWKNQIEIDVFELSLISESKNFPISKKEHGIDFLLKHRHLWIRSKKVRSVFRIRHFISQAIHRFFFDQNFTQTDPPIFTPNACEGTSSLFPVETDFMDSLYLSQSGQMYLEATANSLSKVYCLSPVFRAEKSSTRRHLMEFWMCEAEMAFCDLSQNMKVIENLLVFILQFILKHGLEDLHILSVDPKELEKVKTPFERLHYRDASRMILKKNASFQEGSDIGGADETLLSESFQQPFFVHHYPTVSKAFYMKKDLESAQYSLSCDLLAPKGYGELVGGGQREEDLSVLVQSLRHHQLNQKDFEWYLDLRRYGSFVHSGFGLGIERLICWICGLKHVREAIAFPRVYGRKFFESEGS